MSHDPDFVIRGQRVVTSGGVRPASIHVRGDAIIAVRDFDDVPPGVRIDDARDHFVMPGLVDSHVHLNEPGRTEWEGFATGTRAAAAGGVTTLFDMPLNSMPAVTSVAGLEAKRRAADGQCAIDVGFWGGVVPGNASQLELLADAGVLGFKAFLVPSGVDEFPGVGERDLRIAMPVLTRLNAVLLVHAEVPGPIEAATERVRRESLDGRRYSTYLSTRPREAEHEAIRLMIDCCHEYGTRTHIVHLSSADALPALAAARSSGLPITLETCPHYLFFAAEAIPDGGTRFKCAPPIRERTNNERLWDGLRRGEIQMIVSDHSPAPDEVRWIDTGDFLRAWGGIASLQLGLPIVWTAASSRGFDVHRIAEWMCRAPARLAGLSRKGAIEPGFDADVVIWDPGAEFSVQSSDLHHRHKGTPYAGARLRGVVDRTYLRGQLAYRRGAPWPAPRGRIIPRAST